MDAKTYVYFGFFFLFSGWALLTQFAPAFESGCLEWFTQNAPITDSALICAVRGSAFLTSGAIFFIVGLSMFIYGMISGIGLFLEDMKKKK